MFKKIFDEGGRAGQSILKVVRKIFRRTTPFMRGINFYNNLLKRIYINLILNYNGY